MEQQEKLTVMKFKGLDFPVWKAQIESVVTAKGWNTVLYEDATASTADAATFIKMDNQVKAVLLTSLDPKYARLVIKMKTAKDIWARLSAIHEQKSDSSKLLMQREFFELRLEKGEKVQDYISRAEYLASQLEDIGSPIPDTTLVSKIVSGLNEDFQSFMTMWMAVPLKEQTMSNMLGKLMAEEHMKNQFRRGESSANTSQSDKPQSKSNFKKSSKRNDKKGKRSNFDIKKASCYGCGEKGHLRRDCPRKEKREDKSDNRESSEKEVKSLIAEAHTSCSNDGWIIDSGATEHMTFDASNYVSYRKLDEPKPIRFGNNQYGMGIGTGKIRIISKLTDGSDMIIMLNNVLHVPELGRKLFSIAAATSFGACGDIGKNKITIRDNDGNDMLVAYKQGNLYVASIEEESAEAMVTESKDNLTLLHERFGHVNKTTILDMAKDESVLDKANISLAKDDRGLEEVVDCKACALGKQARKHFTRSSRKRATSVGERVHVDLCGPIGVETIAGNKYFVLFKDEYSNYRFIYLLKGKDEVYECLKKCKAELEADTGKKLKRLISDCESEFTSNRSQKLFLDNSISHSTSAPFTPQQNGFIERENRTVMESARAMLFHKGLPEKLWGEAATTAVYLLNRSCNKNTTPQTPYERYFKEKPKIGHLRVFGSLAFMKLQEKKRSGYQKKLEPRSQEMLFVGYERDYTYRLYDPKTNKITITREVQFDERVTLQSITSEGISYDSVELFITDPVLEPLQENRMNESLADVDCSISDLEVDAGELEESFRSAASQSGQIVDEPIYENIEPDVTLRPSEGDVAESWVSYGDEPLSYSEAKKSPDWNQWEIAMKDEYASLIKNKTWKLTALP